MSEFEPDSPEQRLEGLREMLFGELDELVAEAEDLLEDQGQAVIPKSPDTAQLWDELRAKARAVRTEFEMRKSSIDDVTRRQLEGFLVDLEERAESVFGAKLEETA